MERVLQAIVRNIPILSQTRNNLGIAVRVDLNIDQTIEHHRENKPRERVAPTYFRGGAQPNVIHAKPPANHLAGSKLQAGDTVEHRKFGRGTVIGVKGNIAQVAFAGQGIKELDMQFAPMEKI